jgi:hypothetical protein
MAIPSLLSMAVDGSSLALYFSEALKTILPRSLLPIEQQPA